MDLKHLGNNLVKSVFQSSVGEPRLMIASSENNSVKQGYPLSATGPLTSEQRSLTRTTGQIEFGGRM